MAEKKKAVKAADAKEGEVKAAKETGGAQRSAAWPLITIGIFATVVALAFVIICWWVIAAAWHVAVPTGSHGFERSDRFGPREDRRQFERERRGIWGSYATSGVVTAIDGETVTVSGRGQQVTVKTNDDTVISGDKEELAVNDTVIVYGDEAEDESITATKIIVRNDTIRSERRGDAIRMPDA